MCGLAGVISFDRPIAALVDRLARADAAQSHRGPDGAGVWQGRTAAFAHRRLQMNGGPAAAQPFTSHDGRYVITYNGEVYNHATLRRELAQDYPFRTQSDTEAVLAAFIVWGAAGLTRLNGMFALAIWDEREQRLFAARDCLGVKPFVFRHERRERALWFASEAKALLAASDDPITISAPSLVEYFVTPYFSGTAQPLFSGVRTLAPGHWLRFDAGGLRTERWAAFVPGVAGATTTPEQIALALRSAVDDAVDDMRTGTPLGMFLSGGLDSSALASLARCESNLALPAWTVDFEGAFDTPAARSPMVGEDDTPHAEALANGLGLPYTRVGIANDDLPKLIDAVAEANDALPAWEQELAQYALARAAQPFVKGVLVGDAADETHFGYHFLLNDEVSGSPLALMQRFGLPPLAPRWRGAEHAIAAQLTTLTRAAGFDWHTREERLLAMSLLIVRRWLVRLLHNGDIHTMAHGIEARVPFADIALLREAERVAPRSAFSARDEKRVLRAAVQRWLPNRIMQRRKSALPKPLFCDHTYRTLFLARAATIAETLSDVLDVEAMTGWCRASRPLTEAERGHVFRAIAADRALRHHRVNRIAG